jgi:2-succinyl-6-hydroxy-2,4-cyclohexadiene-1-carboxylate synthase
MRGGSGSGDVARRDPSVQGSVGRSVRLGDVTYGYVEQGVGEPLVLLHGFTGSRGSWWPVMPGLAGRYRVIAVDLLGHGSSDAPPQAGRYAMERVAEDMAALLDHAGVSQAHLVGYSMGGRLALYLALALPQRWRSLVLESSSPGLAAAEERTARAAQDEALAAFTETEGIDAFVDRWERLPLFASQQALPEAVRARQRQQRLNNRPAGLAGSLRGMGTGVQPSLWERLGELAAPVLLLAGEADEKFVAIARQMAEAIPHATLKTVPGAGHTIHLERPEAWLSLVLAWLDGHTP